MSQRLRGPLAVVMPTVHTSADAATRLQRALDERRTIESTSAAKTDRRLAGSVSDLRVDLSVRDQRLTTRRKSWNIEFHGVFDPTPNGSSLRGSIDIPDRRQLHTLMLMFRIAAGMTAILAVALAARDLIQGAPLTAWPTVAALGGLLLVVWFTALMEAHGERAAGEDAELLAAFIRRTLA